VREGTVREFFDVCSWILERGCVLSSWNREAEYHIAELEYRVSTDEKIFLALIKKEYSVDR